jgi:toxin ParE1/3/4
MTWRPSGVGWTTPEPAAWWSIRKCDGGTGSRAEIRWTVEARAEVDAIFEYVAARNEAAARKVVGGIFARVERLADYPRSGRVALSDEIPQVREVFSGAYRIYYWLADEYLEVLSVRHGAQQTLSELLADLGTE